MSTLQNDAMTVSDVMLPLDSFPVLGPRTLLKNALEEMGRSRLGIVCVVDDDKRLLGIVTDGDIRRQLLKMQKPFAAFFGDDVIDHCIKTPSTVASDAPLLSAVSVMEEKRIWDLPVLDEQGRLCGLLHLHPVVKALLNT